MKEKEKGISMEIQREGNNRELKKERKGKAKKDRQCVQGRSGVDFLRPTVWGNLHHIFGTTTYTFPEGVSTTRYKEVKGMT